MAARWLEWLSPHRAQLEAELRGVASMLSDQDIDELIDVGIDLWLAASRRCGGERDPRPDA